MEREVASTIHLAVMLILMAALLSIVLYTVYIGNQAKNDAISKASDITIKMDNGELDSLSNSSDNIMPKASIYYIVAKEYNNVIKLSIDGQLFTVDSDSRWESEGINDKFMYPEDVIRYYGLGGKAKVNVIANKSGLYEVSIQSIN